MSNGRSRLRTVWALVLVLALIGSVAVTGAGATKVKLTLDWTPNTNHTGIYVAKELGYFAEEGLKVSIVQPSKTTSIQLTATGRTEFGVSHQESVTMGRARDIPVVSIAAIIQNNTSGFAAPLEEEISSVEDFAGHKFGGWGSELYNKIIQSVMRDAGADFSTVDFVNVGMTDFVTAARHDMADFFWIFYGWQGVHAQIEGLEFTYIPVRELSETFNYYTPVFIAGEKVIEERPELVRKFLRAVTRGYEYAGNNPERSAEILLEHASELDRELVTESQEYLSDKYSEGVEHWGVQEKVVWERFTAWLLKNDLIERKVDAEKAYTNEFLPVEEDEGD